MEKPINIGSRLELFVDRLLVKSLKNAAFKMHTPQLAPPAASPVKGAYMTVLLDNKKYRAYYRQYNPAYSGEKHDGNKGEMTCYAESRDGQEWSFPKLGLCKVNGNAGNNALLSIPPFSHNFAPFRDANPAAARAAKYKALAGTHRGSPNAAEAKYSAGGLYAFHSPDGLRWKFTADKPVITDPNFCFDSQNVSFWSEAEKCYVCYYRSWRTSHGKLRTISRTTSRDYLHWEKAVDMDPNLPGENLYTSQTHPYFRAPHIYIALPTRYTAGQVGGVKKDAMLGSTDILFMATRAGSPKFERLFTEAFIRPGLDPERWGSRANYAACGVVPTGPAEMSIYHAHSGRRYTLRTDGFISINAGAKAGEFVTRPFIFKGNGLFLNYSTAADGFVRVEMQTAAGKPLKGFALEDCDALVGDSIARAVSWVQVPDMKRFSGRPVRLRFVMKEADLFSIQFR